jgi:hypothetical protein
VAPKLNRKEVAKAMIEIRLTRKDVTITVIVSGTVLAVILVALLARLVL